MVSWIQAYPSNKKVHFLNCTPSEIYVEDIAHHLANICRFNGGISQFYSVAEHCFHVSNLVSPYRALDGLLHDASEAYIGDVVRQQKKHFGNYKAIEKNIMTVIAVKFKLDLNFQAHPEIKLVDEKLAYTEAMRLGKDTDEWPTKQTPFDLGIIGCWKPELAKSRFLNRFWSIYDDSEEITGFKNNAIRKDTKFNICAHNRS